MAAENCMICLFQAMDRLWFNQTVLFPHETPKRYPNSPTNNSQTSFNIREEETISQEKSCDLEESRETRNNGISGFSTKRLRKAEFCRGLGELELKEVKGFMDLGFTFKKENVSKKMMSLIPGLQRINIYKYPDDYDEEEEEDDEEAKLGVIMRPYLSESWLIKRPDSPLLNMRIPRVSSAEDMKKHLKYWARTVALAIQQES